MGRSNVRAGHARDRTPEDLLSVVRFLSPNAHNAGS